MTDWVVWTWGAKGPELSVMRGQKKLNDFERRNKLGDLLEIKSEHEGLSLSELAKPYPCAVNREDGKCP